MPEPNILAWSLIMHTRTSESPGRQDQEQEQGQETSPVQTQKKQYKNQQATDWHNIIQQQCWLSKYGKGIKMGAGQGLRATKPPSHLAEKESNANANAKPIKAHIMAT